MRKKVSGIVLVILGFVLFSCEESRPKDMRKVYLEEDQHKVSSSPDVKTDSVSYFIHDCVGQSLTGIKTNFLKYYTRQKNDTLLVIVKVEDMRKIEKSSRKLLLFAIRDCLLYSEQYSDKKVYIDVEGVFNTLLVQTPVASDLDGKYANEDLLLSFYGKSAIPNKETKKK